MKFFIKIFSLFLLAIVACACSNQELNDQQSAFKNNSIYFHLEDFSIYGSRASGGNWNAQWGTDAFKNGDTAGLYSLGGNADVDDGAGGFENAELYFLDAATTGGFSQFTNDNLNINPTMMYQAYNINMYLGYEKDMNYPGKELRVMPPGEEDYRCIDFIKSIGWTGGNGRNVVNFNHCFSILILTLGEGFSTQKNPDITVVLTKGYSHIRYRYDRTNWVGHPDLIYQEGYIPSGSDKVMTEKECRRWKAWKGGDFQGKPAWYVFLPTNENWSIEKQSIISYIELKDNDGNTQKVSSFVLANNSNSKALFTSKVYPLDIIMDGLEPTIFPYHINDWEGDTDITYGRNRGINDVSGFIDWMGLYNTYIAGNRALEKEEDLYQFGDKIDDVWYFYILTDLDFSNSDILPYIPDMQDCLIGKSGEMDNSAFRNVKISNIKSANPFIGTLEPNALISNIDFENIYVNNTDNSSSGVLCKNIEGGSLSNCLIKNGTLITNGAAGILAGTMTSGSVIDSDFTGFLLGSTTSTSYPGLLGNDPSGQLTLDGANYSDIIFTIR